MTITLDTLVNAKLVDLNKLKKEDIVKAIQTFGFQYKNALTETKEAKAKCELQGAEELAAKKIIAAYVSYEFSEEQKGYSGDINWHKVSLSELIGLMMVKASRY